MSHRNASQDSLTILQDFISAFNRHDIDSIMRLMTADCVFENTYPPPDGERFEGQQAVRDYWEQFFAASPQALFEIEEIFCHEDRGFVRWLYLWGGADQTVGHVRGIDIFRLHDGKIAEKLSYVKG